MARRQINVTHAVTGFAPADRIERLRATLADERATVHNTSLSSWDVRVAERNVENLEDALDRAEHNERLHAQRIADLQAAEDAATAAKRNEEQAALEAELRRKYDRAMPLPVSDAEWEQVKEAVIHHHRLKAMETHEQQVADMRRSGRYSL